MEQDQNHIDFNSECFQDFMNEILTNLSSVRGMARMAMSTSFVHDLESAKRDRQIARRRLDALRKALVNLDEEAFYLLDMAATETKSTFRQGDMVRIIDRAIELGKHKSSPSPYAHLHEAGAYFLEYLESTSVKISYGINEGAKDESKITAEAIKFLHEEFQLLMGTEDDYRQQAVTIIKKWLTSKPKTRSK